MVLQTLLLMIFGQTDAANLDEADNNQIKNAKAKVFVADSVDWNSKNRNKYRNDAQKRSLTAYIIPTSISTIIIILILQNSTS